MKTIEQWGIFEIALEGRPAGNPFTDVALNATFSYQHRQIQVDGFYDGGGVYKIRFMPDTQGEWRYVTHSNHGEFDAKQGEFLCVAPSASNHGPVRIHNAYHFRYADGTPYFPFGTTCYAWVHQGNAMEEQTLQTLKQTPFNKMRMCVFPKHYIYNANEPVYYPFERDDTGQSDFARFNPEFFRHFEQRVEQLRDLGIEADIIIFHPYDRWGYAEMTAEQDGRYLRYLVARLAAYRNVWWSLANEYDFLLEKKPLEQWDRFFQMLETCDPYQHLRSIHQGSLLYDHTKPWVTHVCIQHADVKRAKEWRTLYRKPVINDECQYEGNIPLPWGNITAQELVHRFWIMVANGCYAGHGETYLHPEDLLWWSKGGILRGESWQRIAFLRQVIESGPADGLTPLEDEWVWLHSVTGGFNGNYRLMYFGEHQPAGWSWGLPKDVAYTVEVIDTWKMTITPIDGIFKNAAEIPLPGKPYLAVRIRPVV
ncbi:hypothetical protein U14_02403 [Candidatus Moduliflexus flocculans]|uniref:DUF5060 domain-containing protein n=1 Tax=Candidatus Moduliflexus flocculans TaxID=1499966 RepID=A0A081BL95_9BACT|nr:hypothetical protein U14_02403 [Candidatus Moduliflexus flocculans]